MKKPKFNFKFWAKDKKEKTSDMGKSKLKLSESLKKKLGAGSGVALLIIGVIIFNYFSLFWVASHYYDISSLNTFIIQVSQYKPEMLKGTAILLILLMSIISSVFYTYSYLKVALRTNRVEL